MSRCGEEEGAREPQKSASCEPQTFNAGAAETKKGAGKKSTYAESSPASDSPCMQKKTRKQ